MRRPIYEPTLGRLITVARQLAEEQGISKTGYRLGSQYRDAMEANPSFTFTCT